MKGPSARLSAPNDVVVASDGAVWFTDSGYGIMSDHEGRRAVPELPTTVYRVGADGGASVAADDLSGPNRLCFSPHESVLSVVNSETPLSHRRSVACPGSAA